MKKNLERLQKEFQDANIKNPILIVSADDYNEMAAEKLLLLNYQVTINGIFVNLDPDLKQGEYLTNIPQKF
tara:strand:+ start:153 stop:365 length:213 start_codon:yes stop_codon:yes gene_type:complete